MIGSARTRRDGERRQRTVDVSVTVFFLALAALGLTAKSAAADQNAQVAQTTPTARQIQQSDTGAAASLMNHLAGSWTMRGTLGGKQTIHDVEANWVLKREYLQLHEVSREHGADGVPAYEAIVVLGWYVKTREFMCLWLDNTAGGGLSPQGIAHGRQSGDAIPLVFTLSQRESLHTTFAYNRSADAWRLTIDDVTDGRSQRFGDVTLTRKH